MQQDYLSLEGYTVINPGQRPGIVGGKKKLAWRAAREDGGGSRSAEGALLPPQTGGKISIPQPPARKTFSTSAAKVS